MCKVHEDMQEDDEDVQDEDVQEGVENEDVQEEEDMEDDTPALHASLTALFKVSRGLMAMLLVMYGCSPSCLETAVSTCCQDNHAE